MPRYDYTKTDKAVHLYEIKITVSEPGKIATSLQDEPIVVDATVKPDEARMQESERLYGGIRLADVPEKYRVKAGDPVAAERLDEANVREDEEPSYGSIKLAEVPEKYRVKAGDPVAAERLGEAAVRRAARSSYDGTRLADVPEKYRVKAGDPVAAERLGEARMQETERSLYRGSLLLKLCLKLDEGVDYPELEFSSWLVHESGTRKGPELL